MCECLKRKKEKGIGEQINGMREAKNEIDSDREVEKERGQANLTVGLSDRLAYTRFAVYLSVPTREPPDAGQCVGGRAVIMSPPVRVYYVYCAMGTCVPACVSKYMYMRARSTSWVDAEGRRKSSRPSHR